MHAKWTSLFWTDNWNVRMLTRIHVREDIEELFGDQPSETLQVLEEVMFSILYPTYSKVGRVEVAATRADMIKYLRNDTYRPSL